MNSWSRQLFPVEKLHKLQVLRAQQPPAVCSQNHLHLQIFIFALAGFQLLLNFNVNFGSACDGHTPNLHTCDFIALIHAISHVFDLTLYAIFVQNNICVTLREQKFWNFLNLGLLLVY